MKRKLRLVALVGALCIVAIFGVHGSADVSAQGGAPVIADNIAATYLGPEVVLSGQARAVGGITSVTATVQDTATGQYVQDTAGTLGPTPVALASWAGTLPPPGDPGVSWRVPLTLANGSYEVAIEASSNGTLTALPAIAFQVVDVAVPSLELIPYGANWSYYDAGDLPAADWFATAFDDSSWSVGPAELGYGGGDEATVTNSRRPGNNTVLTQYFRHEFTVGDLSDFSSATLYLLRDDGAAVYLNGVELGRTNLPTGPLGPETLAVSSSEQTVAAPIQLDALIVGTNVLAVEVHQVDPASTDISFNASLVAVPPNQPLESDSTAGTYLLTAGDMANCSFDGDEVVAAQMAELFDTDAGLFLGLGDLAYGSGTINEFLNCYDPSIGQFKDVTWPNAGNHEHYTAPNAAGYRAYFGAAAGPNAGPAGGLWYSFDIDDHWTAIALDSDCRGREVLPGAIDGDGCAVGSEQEQWLRATLEANADRNILAFFHHPPYTNNRYTDHTYTWPLWRALSEYGAEITLHGHEHHYERYGTIDYWGERDAVYGTRQFIIGSGGTFPRYNERPAMPESDFKGTFPFGTNDFGVLQLWLRPDGYEWKWESVNGLAASDSGTSGLTQAMPRAELSGTVTSLANGLFLDGVEVCAVAGRTNVESCTFTDVDGNYTFPSLVSDAYDVTATTTEGATETKLGQVLTAPARTTVNFELPTVAAISGTVTSEATGRPIIAATVCARSLTDAPLRCANTDINGDYTITGLLPDSVLIQFESTGYKTECFQDRVGCIGSNVITIAGLDLVGIDASLEPDPGGIRGTVTIVGSDEPFPGVEVCVTGGSLVAASCTTTAADGTYEVDGLLTANYVVRFEAPPGDREFEIQCYLAADCDSPTPVGVVNPGFRTGIDAVMVEIIPPTPTPTATATPTVTPTLTPTPTVTSTPTPGPSPTPSATPTPSPTPTVTSTPTPSPTPTLTPVPTATPTTPTPTPGIQPTPLPTVTNGGVISGQITELTSGFSVFGAKVCATRLFPAGEWCAFSSLDGTYRIAGLPAGNFSVFANDPGQRFLENCYGVVTCDTPQVFGLAWGATVTDIDIPMDALFSARFPTPTPTPQSDGTISGVVSRNGVPEAGVDVCAESLVSSFARCTVSGSDGSYTITGLRTGNYRVAFDGGSLCYLAKTNCVNATAVGVVAPFGRNFINGDL